MKKLLLITPLIAALTLLSGCKTASYAINAAQVSASVTHLSEQMESVSTALDKNMALFDQAERLQLSMLYIELRDLKRAGQNLLQTHGDIGSVLIKADQVKTLFTTGKLAYIEAKHIIQPRLAELPPELQADLILFDRNAMQLNTSLMTLLSTPGSDITQAVTDVLTLGATAARLSQMAAIL